MPDDLAYLATSAVIIGRDLDGVHLNLSQGAECFLPGSRRAARRLALAHAEAARDRLDELIRELGGE